MPPRIKRRIVICSDGTWNDPEDPNPTNVLRIARAVTPIASRGVDQMVFYDWGVGSYHAKVRGGTTGLGMAKNVQDGYRFIVQNYRPGDDIFLFGFSRGAFTARCLAGMLNNCGILRRENAHMIPEAFELYKKRSIKPGSANARRWRRSRSLGDERDRVAFIGVWDTVGALGIPTRALAFVEERDLFFDRELGSNVEVARHAVSIDERRADFVPTLWEPKEAIDVKQVWFAGVHADVGGGYAPQRGRLLSDIPLAWMAAEAGAAGLELEPHLFDPDGLDPLAPKHNSHRTFWKVLGKSARVLPADAVLHHSVRTRFEAGDYPSSPLADWLNARGGSWGPLES